MFKVQSFGINLPTLNFRLENQDAQAKAHASMLVLGTKK